MRLSARYKPFLLQKLFMEMDSKLWEECTKKYAAEQDAASARLQARERGWETLSAEAKKSPLYKA
jgi:hypothetical protein